MMENDELIPLSYISQYHYCKRRAGLLMLEQQWGESTDTVKGTAEHQHVHTTDVNVRGDVIVLTDMCVISKEMQLFGRCDVVEARKERQGMCFPFLPEGRYVLYPVEYKHGKLRIEREYELQLCAQAMCLEEMYGCSIPKAALFFISSHRRKEILLDDTRRDEVRQTAGSLAQMLADQKVPRPVASARCIRCSLKEICQPDVPESAESYLKRLETGWGSDDV